MENIIGWTLGILGVLDIVLVRWIVAPRIRDGRVRTLVVNAVLASGLLLLALGAAILFGFVPVRIPGAG